jgi:hypothetical protein
MRRNETEFTRMVMQWPMVPADAPLICGGWRGGSDRDGDMQVILVPQRFPMRDMQEVAAAQGLLGSFLVFFTRAGRARRFAICCARVA